MNLLIDIGNTSAKLAVADMPSAPIFTMGVGIVHFERHHEPWADTFARLTNAFPIDSVRISTVAGEDNALKEALGALSIPVYWLTASTPCPIKPIAEVNPALGADRWAADIGALAQDAAHTLLIIDAGTCITYDVISRDGRFLGGAISPGVQLRLKAMHEHTALLPLFEAEEEAVLLGYDTRTSMLSSAVNGSRFEIEGYIRHFFQEYPDLHVFITGGNSFHFSSDILCPVTHDPYLVFRGLNAL